MCILNKSPKCRQCLDYWQPRKRRYFVHLDHFRNDVGLFSMPLQRCLSPGKWIHFGKWVNLLLQTSLYQNNFPTHNQDAHTFRRNGTSAFFIRLKWYDKSNPLYAKPDFGIGSKSTKCRRGWTTGPQNEAISPNWATFAMMWVYLDRSLRLKYYRSRTSPWSNSLEDRIGKP